MIKINENSFKYNLQKQKQKTNKYIKENKYKKWKFNKFS
jgi:hypothetical protein